jgi:hypothetical protein
VAVGEVRTGADVVRDMVAALEPGELPYLESVLEAYRTDPWALGGGLAGIPVDQVTAWAPLVLGLVAETVVELAVPPPAAGRGWFATVLTRRRRGRVAELANVPDSPVPDCDERQLRRLRAAAAAAAADRGYPPRDREAFAAAAVAAFAGQLPRQIRRHRA